MKNLSFVLILAFFIPSQAGKSCEPLPDTPTARLMYYGKNSIYVLPQEPLSEGTVAKLNCNFDTVAEGETSTTCVDGRRNPTSSLVHGSRTPLWITSEQPDNEICLPMRSALIERGCTRTTDTTGGRPFGDFWE
ncbi:hypothetical protein RB195_002344 [Necator americanus]|uniref:Sushi domain-containing protein n=1 Tax=Necator americanus TaxID=51031 RepID=A0ABR1DIM9_NECAM